MRQWPSLETTCGREPCAPTMRPMNMKRMLAGVGVAWMLASGCSDGSSTERVDAAASATPVAIPTNSYKPGTLWQMAHIRGALTAISAGSDSCLGVETVNGVVAVTWPAGYSARFGTKAELLDADGKVVASEGQVLDLSGANGVDVTGPCFEGRSSFAAGPIKVQG